MKIYIRLIIKIHLSLLFILLSACVNTKTVSVTTIHLQEAAVTGPINQAPVHLSKESKTPFFTVSPRFSYKPSEQINASVSGHRHRPTILLSHLSGLSKLFHHLLF